MSNENGNYFKCNIIHRMFHGKNTVCVCLTSAKNNSFCAKLQKEHKNAMPVLALPGSL